MLQEMATSQNGKEMNQAKLKYYVDEYMISADNNENGRISKMEFYKYYKLN